MPQKPIGYAVYPAAVRRGLRPAGAPGDSERPVPSLRCREWQSFDPRTCATTRRLTASHADSRSKRRCRAVSSLRMLPGLFPEGASERRGIGQIIPIAPHTEELGCSQVAQRAMARRWGFSGGKYNDDLRRASGHILWDSQGERTLGVTVVLSLTRCIISSSSSMLPQIGGYSNASAYVKLGGVTLSAAMPMIEITQSALKRTKKRHANLFPTGFECQRGVSTLRAGYGEAVKLVLPQQLYAPDPLESGDSG